MKDLSAMMKQVQDMQARMAEAQAKIEETKVEGRSGAGLVKVAMTGKGAVTGIEIDPSLMKAGEKEILEDLLVAALTDAKAKADAVAAAGMQQVAGGLQLPPGFKLPF